MAYKQLKLWFDGPLAQLLSDKIKAVDPHFKDDGFSSSVDEQVQDLELKDRVEFIADELFERLGSDYPKCIPTLLQILGPENEAETGMFKIYYWIMPEKVEGTWNWVTETDAGKPIKNYIKFKRKYQELSGRVNFPNSNAEIVSAFMNGKRIRFETRVTHNGKRLHIKYRGIVRGNLIVGKQYWRNWTGKWIGAYTWRARREVSRP